ncbi:MAG: extracellular solute-binding protein [Clostridia bacterium]|nr:extracellular solute-binding protein [Clostridia bacterium]
MKRRISIIALLLAVLMVASVFAACQDNTPDESKGGNVSKAEGDERYVADLPEFSWNTSSGTYGTFDVLVYSNKVQTTYYSEDIGYDLYTTTDEVLNTAVMERNNYVEQLTGVEIVAHPVDNVVTTLNDEIASGMSTYDMAMPFMPGAATLAQEGKLHALNSEKLSAYIDLSQPWWDANATSGLSVDGIVYFTTGDISIMQKVVSTAVTFNKDMYASLFPGEKTLYEMVDDGEWTLDKMIELAKKATVQDGDGDWDIDDQWGCSASHGDANMFYLASGNTICAKDSDDLPVFSMNSNSSVSAAIKVLEALQTDGWAIMAQDMSQMGATDIWKASLDVFGEGRALFRTTAFSAIKKLRAYEEGVEFGIVPMPKLNAEQEKYYTPCSAHMAYAVVIPNCVEDEEFSAYMTELVCCEAKNYVTDAYYEVTLKKRDSKDDETERMLDLIFSNVIYDTGYIYGFSGASSILTNLMGSKGTDVQSSVEEIEDSIESAIEDTIENFRD